MIFGVPCEGAVVFGIFENLAHRVKDFFLGVRGVRWQMTGKKQV